MTKKEIKKIEGRVTIGSKGGITLQVPRKVYINGKFVREDFEKIGMPDELLIEHLGSIPRENDILEITYPGNFVGIVRIKTIRKLRKVEPQEGLTVCLETDPDWERKSPLLTKAILDAEAILI